MVVIEIYSDEAVYMYTSSNMPVLSSVTSLRLYSACRCASVKLGIQSATTIMALLLSIHGRLQTFPCVITASPSLTFL